VKLQLAGILMVLSVMQLPGKVNKCSGELWFHIFPYNIVIKGLDYIIGSHKSKISNLKSKIHFPVASF